MASDWSGAQNDLSLQVQIDERFALNAGRQFRHNTEMPDGVDRTDTLLTANIEVGI
jgi:putative salt-induced outer membrane protein